MRYFRAKSKKTASVMLRPGRLKGRCPVMIDVGNSTHGFANVNDGQTGSLKSGPFGAAQILWKESSTGLKWAIVQIGLPAGNRDFAAKITNQGPEAEPDKTNQLYWVIEQNMSWVVHTQTLYFSDMTGGRHVLAYSLDEFGSTYSHSLPTDKSVVVLIHERGGNTGGFYYVFTGPSIIVTGE